MSVTSPSARSASSSRGTQYICKKPWPSSCFVQCGAKGVVLSAAGNYQTAFFEAFPDTFIRGEGSTVEEAEACAWEDYQHQLNCPGHDYVRRGNSEHGSCRHCGRFQTNAFKPAHSCSVCGKPHVNLDFYNAHLCLKHFLELARDPFRNGVHYGSDKPSSLYEPAEIAQLYRESVWAAELLMRLGLMPVDVEDHQVSRYLSGKAFDLRLNHERHAILEGFYREWIAENSDQSLGGMQFIVLVDSFLEGEQDFKDITVAALYAKGLITQGVSDIRMAQLKSKAFGMFGPAAMEFRRRRSLVGSHDQA